jgi:hypothetical protein
MTLHLCRRMYRISSMFDASRTKEEIAHAAV